MPATGTGSIFSRQVAHRIHLGFVLAGEAENLLQLAHLAGALETVS